MPAISALIKADWLALNVPAMVKFSTILPACAWVKVTVAGGIPPPAPAPCCSPDEQATMNTDNKKAVYFFIEKSQRLKVTAAHFGKITTPTGCGLLLFFLHIFFDIECHTGDF